MIGDIEARILAVERSLRFLQQTTAGMELRAIAAGEDLTNLEQIAAVSLCTVNLALTMTYGGAAWVGNVANFSVVDPGGSTRAGPLTLGGGTGTWTGLYGGQGNWTLDYDLPCSLGPSSGTVALACGANTITYDVPYGTHAINLHIVGCSGLDFPGCAVTVKIFGTATVVGTCTTDGTGRCSVPITTPGHYTITVVDPLGRFVDITSSPTVYCDVNSFLGFSTFHAGYACVENVCVEPIATTLHLTNNYGTVTLTSSGPPGFIYGGSQVIALPSVASICSTTCPAGVLPAGNAKVTWTYAFGNPGVSGVYQYCTRAGVKTPLDSTRAGNCGTTQSLTMARTSLTCPPSYQWQGTATDPNGIFTFGAMTMVE